MKTTREEDVELFTKTVLLVSSSARVAVEELDVLISQGVKDNRHLQRLKRARASVAGLATIVDYLE